MNISRLSPYRASLAAVAAVLTTSALARPVFFDSFEGKQIGTSVNACNPEIGSETFTCAGGGLPCKLCPPRTRRWICPPSP